MFRNDAVIIGLSTTFHSLVLQSGSQLSLFLCLADKLQRLRKVQYLDICNRDSCECCSRFARNTLTFRWQYLKFKTNVIVFK